MYKAQMIRTHWLYHAMKFWQSFAKEHVASTKALRQTHLICSRNKEMPSVAGT